MARKKMTKKRRRSILKWVRRIFIFIFFILIGIGVGDNLPSQSGNFFEETGTSIITELKQTFQRFLHSNDQNDHPVEAGEATLRVLDVGQGSASLLQSSDGTNILIDTGRHDDSDRRILQYLDRYIGTGGTIDLLVLTHNHTDHIGLADRVLNYYSVGEVWMNGIDTTSRTYEKVLDAITASPQTTYLEPEAGHVTQVGPFYIEVLWPHANYDSTDQNNQSIVTRVTVNGVTVLQSGDAETTVEKQIIQQGFNLHSNILIVGHHGSNTSSSEEWVRAVSPDVAVYSAGVGNQYGHPHGEVAQLYSQLNVPLYGTAVNGAVTFTMQPNGSYYMHLEKE